jgi:hypothetical protein
VVDNKAIAALRKQLKAKNVDKFQTGDVIRWVAGGIYSYAAIKTPVGWYTTASTAAYRHVAQILQWDDLLDVLSRSEATEIQVAIEWEDI